MPMGITGSSGRATTKLSNNMKYARQRQQQGVDPCEGVPAAVFALIEQTYSSLFWQYTKKLCLTESRMSIFIRLNHE
jgi:hypothetical protein